MEAVPVNTQQLENREVLLKRQESYTRKVNPPPLTKQTPLVPKPNPTPPPPKNANPPNDYKNLYKSNSAFSIKNQLKSTEPTYYKNASFDQQSYTQFVNLESLPDNSEQPDIMPQHLHKTNQNKSQQPENNEVAPMNDRNQYLETGQLSDESTNLQVDNDTLPPPGLRRMVLGQIEQNENTVQNTSDEPPPGLSRMVLGQTESNSSSVNKKEMDSQLLVGFHRMIPGKFSQIFCFILYEN